MIEHIINNISSRLQECSFIKGIVLGGSRATGTASENSDIDIGIYYEKSSIDFEVLNTIATQLDDSHRDNLICDEGGWGTWVNCGGWLLIEGYHVDLIFRDIERVKKCILDTDSGKISAHYQPGHPHAFINVMYRGELASSRILYAKNDSFIALKEQSEIYSHTLQSALTSFFMFEAKFSWDFCRKSLISNDIYYVSGHLFRAISALNQVLFALNQVYCLNEKKATLRINRFAIAPVDYYNRVNQLFMLVSQDLSEVVNKLEQLCDEVEILINNK